MTISSLFFQRLKEARKQLGLNQASAADLVGVTREHWGRCERGDAVPGGEVLAALANAGANVQYVLTGSREGPEPEILTDEERVMLDYFRQASAPVRKAALGALLSSAPDSDGIGIRASKGRLTSKVINAPTVGNVSGGSVSINNKVKSNR